VRIAVVKVDKASRCRYGIVVGIVVGTGIAQVGGQARKAAVDHSKVGMAVGMAVEWAGRQAAVDHSTAVKTAVV
jgi:hypothetical protein